MSSVNDNKITADELFQAAKMEKLRLEENNGVHTDKEETSVASLTEKRACKILSKYLGIRLHSLSDYRNLFPLRPIELLIKQPKSVSLELFEDFIEEPKNDLVYCHRAAEDFLDEDWRLAGFPYGVVFTRYRTQAEWAIWCLHNWPFGDVWTTEEPFLVFRTSGKKAVTLILEPLASTAKRIYKELERMEKW